MPTITYNYNVLGNQFVVECDVVEKVNQDTYRIVYRDPVLNEHTSDIVSRDRLNFPPFGDLVC